MRAFQGFLPNLIKCSSLVPKKNVCVSCVVDFCWAYFLPGVLEEGNGLQVQNLWHVIWLFLLKIDLKEVNGVIPW